MMKYKTHADANSLYNTPNCYCIYICGKVFKWLKKQGGLEAMKERNEKKARSCMIIWMKVNCSREP